MVLLLLADDPQLIAQTVPTPLLLQIENSTTAMRLDLGERDRRRQQDAPLSWPAQSQSTAPKVSENWHDECKRISGRSTALSSPSRSNCI